MATNQQTDEHVLSLRGSTTAGNGHGGQAPVAATGISLRPHLRLDQPAVESAAYPVRLSPEAFYPRAYRAMYLSRRLDEWLFELYQKKYVRGTVTMGIGSEATAVGMAMPLRPGKDPVSLLHRDIGAHLVLGATPYQIVCQYMANAESPTHGREGNAHHGNAHRRRFPMISHLGKMLSLTVGATWAARRAHETVFGLTVIGDGGTSTGEFHEALNLASVLRAPVIFLVENNHYAFSTPTSRQYHCKQLSDRAPGYGIEGVTIDGTDVWAVYSTVRDAMDRMHQNGLPRIIECMTLRLHGHAVYDKAAYVSREQREAWWSRDPLPRTRRTIEEMGLLTASRITEIEQEVDEELQVAVAKALKVARPQPPARGPAVYSPGLPSAAKPFQARKVKNGDAVNLALDYLLAHNPRAFIAGMDVGEYGSAFKTCKGLVERFGPERVIDMPVCESGIMGFCLGASQVGARPIIEFQFADFSTEAVTQLGLNAATWFFRTGREAPLLVRLPCGGGLTLGAFHSGEFEGLWSRFPGLKLLYPATPQETFEALVAGFYDRNPCLVFENKLLYWSRSGDIEFDGGLQAAWRARRYTEGTELTVVAFGAMVHEATSAAAAAGRSVEVWNPFVLQPLELGPILKSVQKTGRLLVVQESGQTQGLGDQVISRIVREDPSLLKSAPRLVAGPDTPVPFAPELEFNVRPSADKIVSVIHEMLAKS